jgi:carbon-monoxide dehydrogenase medium subunit
VDEAIGLLTKHGEEAKLLAGGQSLLPLMKLRLAAPEVLVDVAPIDELRYVRLDGDEIAIGALSRHQDLNADAVLREHAPLLAHVAGAIADLQIRHRGTIGGSLAHADPSGDLGSVMLAMGASVILKSKEAEREVPVVDLLVGAFETSIEPTEILTEIRVPQPGPQVGGTYLKLERKIGDYATVAAATFLSLENGAIGTAGIGLTSVGLSNIKATDAERALAGQTPSDDLFAEAGRLAAAASNPVADVRGSETYKKHMVEVYVRRGLAKAAETAAAA